MRTTGAAVPHRRLLGLLRLADRGSNGFPAERQLALDKALTIARDNAIAVGDLIEAHRLDVSDLRRPARWPIPPEPAASRAAPRPPSRQDCAGVYRVAGFRYHEGPISRHRMRPGDPVALQASADNPRDPFAVRVAWRGMDIGHIPWGRSVAIWRRLRARMPLDASVARFVPGWGLPGEAQIEIR